MNTRKCPECGFAGDEWRGQAVVAQICPACARSGHWSRMIEPDEWTQKLARLHSDGYSAKASAMERTCTAEREKAS